MTKKLLITGAARSGMVRGAKYNIQYPEYTSI